MTLPSDAVREDVARAFSAIGEIALRVDWEDERVARSILRALEAVAAIELETDLASPAAAAEH